jgi:outer membrane murein-binding lipoprotein Lpp
MDARIAVVGLIGVALTGCASDQHKLSEAQAQIGDLRAEVASLRAENQRLQAQLDEPARPATAYLSGYVLKVPKFDLAVPVRPLRPRPPDWKWTLDVNSTNVVDLEDQPIYGTASIRAGGQTVTIRNASPTTLPTTKPASQK